MDKRYSPVTIPNTELRSLSSLHVDQEYLIHVALPHDYDESGLDYPVVYVLDANTVFGIFTETSRLLGFLNELPDMIIVGIGYPENDIQTLSLRMRDFTPTRDDAFALKWFEEISKTLSVPLEFKGTGGASDFLHFIRHELMPFISFNYRVGPGAGSGAPALAGKSLGGLFALYTLFHQPEAFDRYIIGSPSIWWDGKITLAYEAHFAAANTQLPAKVFMSVGSLENDHSDFNMVDNVELLVDVMKGRGYEDLELKAHLFEDETHFSVIPATFSKGLRAVFG